MSSQWLLTLHDEKKGLYSKILGLSQEDGLSLESKIVGIGRIGEYPFPSIDNVLFIEGLKHKLLSISQLCDNEYDVFFNKRECIKLEHAGLKLISKLKKHNLTDLLYDACQKGKQVKESFESKSIVSICRLLELLYIDLFGPTKIASMSRKRYGLVMVDDYSRWTRVMFLIHIDELFKFFFIFYKRVQNKKDINITSTRSDHGREFKNENFQRFYEEHGILHNFSYPRTPQRNEVMERKNRSSRDGKNHTPYELWKDRQPNISYFHHFRCECFIMNTKDSLGKFNSKLDKEKLLGYSNASKTYKVIIRANESLADLNLENLQMLSKELCFDEDPKEDKSDLSSRNWQMKTYHLEQFILGNVQDKAQVVLLSKVEPKSIDDALLDEGWIKAMQEEVDQNKLDENGKVVRNKARLEAICIFYSLQLNHMRLHQMNLKRLFMAQTSNSCLILKKLSSFLMKNEDGIYIHQTKYVKELIKKFNLEDCKSMSIPKHTTSILTLDDSNKKVDQTSYRGMIGSLLYLTTSRLDIVFSVCLCACFQVDPRESHLTIVKHIFRYLKGITNLGLLSTG
ncbi:hypothetical protein CR513_42270, partial [Mucuna pruriens]